MKLRLIAAFAALSGVTGAASAQDTVLGGSSPFVSSSGALRLKVEIKTAFAAGTQVLAARFDNLKEGAPVLVRAADDAPAKKAG